LGHPDRLFNLPDRLFNLPDRLFNLPDRLFNLPDRCGDRQPLRLARQSSQLISDLRYSGSDPSIHQIRSHHFPIRSQFLDSVFDPLRHFRHPSVGTPWEIQRIVCQLASSAAPGLSPPHGARPVIVLKRGLTLA
jgi:hypothetical protein